MSEFYGLKVNYVFLTTLVMPSSLKKFMIYKLVRYWLCCSSPLPLLSDPLAPKPSPPRAAPPLSACRLLAINVIEEHCLYIRRQNRRVRSECGYEVGNNSLLPLTLPEVDGGNGLVVAITFKMS